MCNDARVKGGENKNNVLACSEPETVLLLYMVRNKRVLWMLFFVRFEQNTLLKASCTRFGVAAYKLPRKDGQFCLYLYKSLYLRNR